MDSSLRAKAARLPLFQQQSAEQLAALLTGAEEVTLKHRETLFAADGPAPYFYVVLTGALKLLRTGGAGENVVMLFAVPGDAVAALIMRMPGSTYPISAVSMGPSSVLRLPRATFNEAWVTNGPVQQFLGAMFFSRMSHLHHEKVMAKAALPEKVAYQLVSLIERFSGGEDTIVPVPLTRQDIADAVGASVESVIRVMSEWSREGLISTSDKLIEVKRLDRLLEIMKRGN